MTQRTAVKAAPGAAKFLIGLALVTNDLERQNSRYIEKAGGSLFLSLLGLEIAIADTRVSRAARISTVAD